MLDHTCSSCGYSCKNRSTVERISEQLEELLPSAFFTLFLVFMVIVMIACAGKAKADTGTPPLGDVAPYATLLKYAEQRGIPVREVGTACQSPTWCVVGKTDYKAITVSREIPAEAKVCVLAHELSHVALRTTETDAYYVGAAICDALGYDARKGQAETMRTHFPGTVSRKAIAFASTLISITTP